MADLKEIAEALLSTTTVSFAATGQTILYTVPTGKTCIVTKAIVVAGADAVESDITIGVTGTWDNWLGANGIGGADLALDELDAAGEYTIITPVTDTATTVGSVSVLTRYTAGEVIKVDVTVAGGGATNTIHLFGFLIDA